MSALVTVVVPIYNVEKYLDRCLTSIVGQTYQNLEILLIDDGSTDGCPQLCDAYAARDTRIRVIHKQNQGLGMARNTGLDAATGDYICFFDSDDFVEPDTIEACVAAAREQGADMVVFGHDDVTPEGTVLQTYVPHPPKALWEGEEITHRLLPMSLCADGHTGEDWGVVLSAWNKLYALPAIRQSGWRFVSEREIISEDYYSLTDLHRYINRVYILNKALYHYTVNTASLSRSFKVDRFDKIKKFYTAMVTLSRDMGLSDTLDQPIKGVSFGLTIGAMKQIVAAALPLRQRYAALKSMVCDDTLQTWVRTIDYRGVGLQKKLLYTAVKRKWVFLCYLFLYLKNRQAAR